MRAISTILSGTNPAAGLAGHAWRAPATGTLLVSAVLASSLIATSVLAAPPVEQPRTATVARGEKGGEKGQAAPTQPSRPSAAPSARPAAFG